MACAFALLAGAGAVTAQSCAEPEATFYIAQALSSTVVVDISGGYSVMCGTTPLSAPEVWIGVDCKGEFFGPIGACFGVRSELTPSTTAARIEKRTIVLTQADATLAGAKGTFAASGELDPLIPGSNPQDVAVFLYFGSAADLDPLLKAGSEQGSIVLHGRTTGNLDLVTPRYDFEAAVSIVNTCPTK